MFSGSSAHPSRPQNAPQGFAAFAPQTSGFAATSSSASGFGFGGSSSSPFGSTAAIATPTVGGGFSFGGGSTSVPAATATTGGGFSFGGSSSSTSLGSLFGPPGGAAPSKPPAFWKPPASVPVATTAHSTGGFGGVTATGGFGDHSGFPSSNPLGRGLTTRACFAVNDDQRFAKPAFQASKPSPWAMITSIAAPYTTASPPPVPKSSVWLGSTQATTRVPSWGERSANLTTMYAPTPIVEANTQNAQLMSISGMPVHANLSVEELRIATRGKTQSFVSPSIAPTKAARPSSGFTFGVDRNSTTDTMPRESWSIDPAPTTRFGPQQVKADQVDAGNPFSRLDPAAKLTPPPFGFGPSTGRRTYTTTSGGGGFLFGLGTPGSTSASPFGVVPTGNTASTVTSDGGLFAPRTAGTFTPLFGPPTTNPAPLAASLFWKPPTEEPAPLPAPRSGSLFGTTEMTTAWTTGNSEQPPKFSFMKASDEQTTTSVRFGGVECTVGQTLPVTTTSGLGDAPSTAPSGSEPGEQEAVSVVETANTPGAENEPGSLALPRLTQSYSKVSGSRAKAFVRRAGAVGYKAFDTQNTRLAVAAMTSSRKFSHELSSSPAKKPIERIVVGRRDAEPWKRSDFQFKSSLFAKSAHVTASAFMAETQRSESKTPEEKEEAVTDETHEQNVEAEQEQQAPVTETPVSLDLDNYDL